MTDQKTGTKILWILQNSGKNRNPIISTRTRSTLENTQRLSRFAPRTIQILIRSTEDTNPSTARRNRGRKRIRSGTDHKKRRTRNKVTNQRTNPDNQVIILYSQMGRIPERRVYLRTG